jgi:hypothetical protein
MLANVAARTWRPSSLLPFLAFPALSTGLGLVITHPGHAKLAVAVVGGAICIVIVAVKPVIALRVGVAAMALPYTWSLSIPKISGAFGVAVPLLFAVGSFASMGRFRFTRMDGVIVAFAVTPALIGLVQHQPFHVTQFVPPTILIPYFGFRIMFDRSSAVREAFPLIVIWVGVVAAIYGIVETATSHNFLIDLYGNPALGEWGKPLYRLGILRAQSTFGHPIAFGTFLLVPISYAAVRKGARFFIATSIMLVAEVATLSRGPWIAVAAVLILVLSASKRSAIFLFAASVALMFVGPAQRLVVESHSSSSEAGVNATYRVGLLHAAIHRLTLAGHPFTDLTTAIPNFPDVTSLVAGTIIQTGAVGLVELGCVVGIAVVSLRRAMRSANRVYLGAAVAVVGQLVALVSVTLITSYQFFFWASLAYLVGLELSLREASDMASHHHLEPYRPVGLGA